ncbi:MAG: MaoC family dehydratase [Hyphomicrobiales bacterium]
MTPDALQLPAPEISTPVTPDQVKAFAVASLDDNPIHLSADAARAAGLDGPVLHGMLIAGRFETYLERIAGHQIVRLQVRFVRPAPVGSSLTIAARLIGPPGSRLHLRLLATIGQGTLVAIGEALLEPLSGPAE